MPVSPARCAAFEILRRVEAEDAYSSTLLAALPQSLREEDRALTYELVLGVLRRQLWLDHSLEYFSARAPNQLDLPVRLALRLGLYQLRFLSRIPPAAAVNESVNLVRVARLKSAASFVNAVLRRATREPDYDPRASASNEIDRLSIETSHPRWMIERWIDAFGPSETASLAHANNDSAPIAFRLTAKAKRTRSDLIETVLASDSISRSVITPDSWRTRKSSKDLRKLSRDGLIYFQDEASQLVAHVLNVRESDRVLDVCAAPGSKSTHIAAVAPEAAIFAGDLYEHRLRLLRRLAETQGVESLSLFAHNAEDQLPFRQDSFERVLVDAPCSGTGTLRQNPEIRWRLSSADIDLLANRQRRILKNAARVLAPGGLLIYSTCSIEPDENEAVVTDFLKEHENFSEAELDISSELRTKAGAARTWPHRNDVDGFFIKGLRRQRQETQH